MSLTKVTYSMIDGAPVNVKDFGATGDGATDDTAAIQSAVNYAVVNSITVNGRPCTVYFPHGTYKVTDTITIAGAVALQGDGAPMSISGARILQYTANKSLFSVTGATNAAIYINGLLMRDVSGVANPAVGLFHAAANVTSGNSFYFRDCWFSTPSYYAINVLCNSDDLQIIDCTFDVTAQKFINIGSTSKSVSNFVIQGCTFYAGFSGLGFIDVINASAGVIANNRFYEGGAFDIPYAISFPNALSTNITIDGNTCNGPANFVSTQSGRMVISNNNVTNGGVAIAIGGGLTISGLVITGNYLNGSSSASFGVIDCTGTSITNSVISNNVINGNSSSGYALNLASTSFQSNVISNNAVTGCTVNNAGAGVWTPTFGGTSTDGSISYTTQEGKWEMNGNSITLTFKVKANVVSSTPTGELVIKGIPIIGGPTRAYGSVAAETFNYPAGGYTQTSLDIAPSGIWLRPIFSGDNLALSPGNGTSLAAGDSFQGQITYSLI